MLTFTDQHTSLRSTLVGRNPDLVSTFDGYSQALKNWTDGGMLPRSSLIGRTVLDAGCWHGVFSSVLLTAGARSVIACDPYLRIEQVPDAVRALDGLTFLGCEVADVRRQLGDVSVDLIFCSTVTEHVRDLGSFLRGCFDLLAPGGIFFFNHDNYYQPVGSHDHGFLFMDAAAGAIVRQGPDCWNFAEKCEASRDFRVRLRQRGPQSWDDNLEARRTPESCNRCPYYKRSQPWAHLLYQDSFRDTFRDEFYLSTDSGGELNKVTPFQLRQYLIEAGFKVRRFERCILNNTPPPELGPTGISDLDLRTMQMTGYAEKEP